MSKAQDTMSATVDALISMIEEGASPADWSAPWHLAGSLWAPHNAHTGHHYRGGNVVQLALTAMLSGNGSQGYWSTYKGWQELGAQVRKGEKGTTIIRPIPRKAREEGDSDKGAGETGDSSSSSSPGIYWGCLSVFASEQVDGWQSPAGELEALELGDRERLALEVLEATGAEVRHGQGGAFYSRGVDWIGLPERDAFRDAGSYIATRAHETVHWTGAPHRLNRKKGATFGDADYALEELIAELGAAMFCARASLSSTPRADHAQYLASWCKSLREKPQALWSCAGASGAAVELILELADKGGRRLEAPAQAVAA